MAERGGAHVQAQLLQLGETPSQNENRMTVGVLRGEHWPQPVQDPGCNSHTIGNDPSNNTPEESGGDPGRTRLLPTVVN